MTSRLDIRAYLNGRDFTERLLGDIVWEKGRPNPGNIRREIQAGRADVRLDNSDGFFTKRIGRFYILPNARLSVGVTHDGVTSWPVTQYRISGYAQNPIGGGYTVIDATFGGAMYRITSSETVIPAVIAGRADRVLRTLVDYVDPTIRIENPNNLMQQGVVVYENRLMDGILSLLQLTDTTLIETGGTRFAADYIEIVDMASGVPYHLYDGGLNSEIPIFVRE